MIEIAPASEFKMTHDEAKLYCAFCNYDGYTDWRMPTMQEVIRHNLRSWGVEYNRARRRFYIIPIRDV